MRSKQDVASCRRDTARPPALGSGQIIGYLDGQQFGSGQASQLWHRNNVGLGDRHVGTRFNTIGFPAGEGSGDFGFVGLMDDVRVYNRTLSAAEVAALMSQEVTMTVRQEKGTGVIFVDVCGGWG